MTILVDSDVLIEVSRGRKRAVLDAWEAAIDEGLNLACSPVTIAELWRGARPPEFVLLEGLFGALSALPIRSSTGKLAGNILRTYSGSHGVELADSLIASTALEYDAELWTHNHKHYPSPEIRFYRP